MKSKTIIVNQTEEIKSRKIIQGTQLKLSTFFVQSCVGAKLRSVKSESKWTGYAFATAIRNARNTNKDRLMSLCSEGCERPI